MSLSSLCLASPASSFDSTAAPYCRSWSPSMRSRHPTARCALTLRRKGASPNAALCARLRRRERPLRPRRSASVCSDASTAWIHPCRLSTAAVTAGTSGSSPAVSTAKKRNTYCKSSLVLIDTLGCAMSSVIERMPESPCALALPTMKGPGQSRTHSSMYRNPRRHACFSLPLVAASAKAPLIATKPSVMCLGTSPCHRSCKVGCAKA
mmetsp:Transcript_34100/g.108878  ORF Transcript_34100/g.108878 Transcript_34100/m.108878 type:complete len:208 (-) Transcript_34100:549-1172(-)